MADIQFREGVWYMLPNGQEFTLLPGERSSYLLCGREGETEEAVIDYRLSRDGRIYLGGTRTNWGAEHLTDTGRSVVKKAAAASR